MGLVTKLRLRRLMGSMTRDEAEEILEAELSNPFKVHTVEEMVKLNEARRVLLEELEEIMEELPEKVRKQIRQKLRS